MHLLNPCIFEDGLFLTPKCKTMRTTHAFHNKNDLEHTNNHQSYKQTNNSSGDTGPNSHVLSHRMPSPNLIAMADEKTTTASMPGLRNTEMPTDPYEDLPTGAPETLPQEATQRSTAIAFMGKWSRDHDLKIVIAAVLSNKDHNRRHTVFEKWAHYTRTTTATANLTARIVHISLAEALCQCQCLPTINNEHCNTKNLAGALTAHLNIQNQTKMFNNWWQHTQDNSTVLRPHV